MRKSPACVLRRAVEEPSIRQGLILHTQSISSKHVSVNMNLFFKSGRNKGFNNIHWDITYYWLSQTFVIFHRGKWQSNMKVNE